jgi:hypothetical protein
MTIETCKYSEISTREVSFDQFWRNSRFNTKSFGFDGNSFAKNAFSKMEGDGGFATFIECSGGSRFAGSLVVFKDPWYRSFRRKDVACFGLVTASDSSVLESLLGAASQEIEKHDISVMRGPVNAPRF